MSTEDRRKRRRIEENNKMGTEKGGKYERSERKEKPDRSRGRGKEVGTYALKKFAQAS